MKVHMWYKYTGGQISLLRHPGNFVGEGEMITLETTTVPPDNQSKSGYHLVEIQSDLPKPSPQVESAKLPAFPKTHQELDSLLSSIGTPRLERAVCQWRAEGYVTSHEFQNLYPHLAQLVREFDKLRQDLSRAVIAGLPREA